MPTTVCSQKGHSPTGHDPAVGRPSRVLGELDAAFDHVLSMPLHCLSRTELDDWINQTQRLASRMAAMACNAATAADQAGVQLLGPHRTLADHVATQARIESSTIGSDLLLGRWLQRFPDFAEAAAAGTLSRRHLQILRSNDNARTHRAMWDAQIFFIDLAATLVWKDFNEALRYWVLAADPDGDEPKEQIKKRHVRLGTGGDGFTSGQFGYDPLTGAMIKGAIEHEAQQLWRDEQAGNHALRTKAQRQADALAALVARGTKSGKGQRPLIHLVISDEVLADTAIRLACGDRDDPQRTSLPSWLDPNGLPLAWGDVDRRCELVDGTPIHPRLVAALVNIADLRRLVLTAQSEVADLGTQVRFYPRHMKDAILAAGRGRCEVQGCGAPLSWIQADHHQPHVRGGRTSLDNGRPRCDPHNKAKGDRAPP